jgi:glycine dehydrogenase subunit 1
VAELCYHKAHYAAAEIGRLPAFRLWNEAEFFNEFVVACPQPVAEINEHLLEHEIIGGYDLGVEVPQLAGHMLIAVTEMNSRDEIDDLVAALEEAAHD